MDKRILFLFIFWLVSASGYAQEDVSAIKGRVFLDKNKNGVQDQKERGLRNIPVSNGKDIVYTDRNGFYELKAKRGVSIFPIIPSNHKLTGIAGKVDNAAFFYYSESVDRDTLINFPLIKEKQPSVFKVGAIGDIQVGTSDEVEYAAKTIFPELLGRNDLEFNIILGDLLNDKTSLFPIIKDMINKLPAHSWAVMGNHDRNTENQAQPDDLFNIHFGAGTYAFNYGNVHFIVFNNVFSTGKHSYEGRLTESQLQFLENDLKSVKKDQQIVISQHIPMLYTRNKGEVLEILKPFSKVLILSGHTHQVSRHFYNDGSVHELVVGAPSGMWWTGEKDWNNVPHALMQDGSPRNYFTVNFTKSDYNIQYKGIGLDANHQMDIRVDSTRVAATIYGASDSSEVWMKVDGEEWVQMKKEQIVSPAVENIIAKNKAKVYPSKGSRGNPLRRRASPHVWTAAVDRRTDSVKTIRIRAVDSYGFEAEGWLVFR